MNRELLFYLLWDFEEGMYRYKSMYFEIYADKSSFSTLLPQEKANFLGLKLYSQNEVEEIRTASREIKSVKASKTGWLDGRALGEPYQNSPFLIGSAKELITHLCQHELLTPVTVRVQRIGKLTAFCEPVFSFEVKPFAQRDNYDLYGKQNYLQENDHE